MKIYIGPYKKWVGPYQIADMIFFVNRRGIYEDPKNETWRYKTAERFGEWLAETWVTKFCSWVGHKRKRKIVVFLAPHDTWNMDDTLSHIIHPMLLQLKKAKHGSAPVADEDVPEHLKSTAAPPKENEWDADDLVHDRWDWVIDEMIFAFGNKANDEWREPFYKSKDYESMREIEKRMSNGFRLFGKYYEGLWD
jgi:hypothetical protein